MIAILLILVGISWISLKGKSQKPPLVTPQPAKIQPTPSPSEEKPYYIQGRVITKGENFLIVLTQIPTQQTPSPEESAFDRREVKVNVTPETKIFDQMRNPLTLNDVGIQDSVYIKATAKIENITETQEVTAVWIQVVKL